MLAFHLFPLVLVVMGENDADWAFMGTKYSTRNKRGEFAESRVNEQTILEYVQGNSAPELSDALAVNFKKTQILEFKGGDKAYVDDVVGDTTCPYEIRAVSHLFFSEQLSLSKCQLEHTYYFKLICFELTRS